MQRAVSCGRKQGSPAIDILDAQIHFGPADTHRVLAVMDALGISRAVLDEYWGYDAPGPGFTLPNGARRYTGPSAEIAVAQHPDRFATVQRLDVADPGNRAIVDLLHDSPGVRGIRVTPGLTEAEVAAFAQGLYADLFRWAVEAELAVVVMIQGRVDLLVPHLRELPRGRFVIDHCGMPLEASLRRPGSSIQAAPETDSGHRYFDEVLALAEHPNVALKWAHAQGIFEETEFPFDGLTRYLRRAVDAFGADRVFWASDGTVLRDTTWADTLYFIKGNPAFTAEEKRALLGGTAARWLDWK